MMRFRSMTLVSAAALAVSMAQVSTASAQEAAPRQISLADALAQARQNQPDLRVTRAQTEVAHTAVTRARSPYYPNLSASASYSYGDSGIGAEGEAGNWDDPSGAGRLSLSAGWLLWDFGQTRASVGAAEADAATSDADLLQAQLDLDLNVRNAYFVARATKNLLVVRKETLANEEKHLEQVEAFVEVGRRPEIDRYQARTAVATARVDVINAENDYAVARAQLARQVGDPNVFELDVTDESMPAVAGEDGDDAALYKEAVSSRPDLAALEQARRASTFSVDAARAAFLPELSAGAGIDGVVLQEDKDPTWGWSVGLTLSWSIFDGGSRSANVDAARAGVVIADARRDAATQNVRVELRQARLAVRAAKAAQEAAAEALENAKKQLELAEGRYNEGVGNVIELGDAQVGLSSASSSVVQAEFTLAKARAQLTHALGR
jgi:outer membrane protein